MTSLSESSLVKLVMVSYHLFFIGFLLQLILKFFFKVANFYDIFLLGILVTFFRSLVNFTLIIFII